MPRLAQNCRPPCAPPGEALTRADRPAPNARDGQGKDPDAAHHCHRRPAECRQVDAVQPPDRAAHRAGLGHAGPDPRPPRGRRRYRRPRDERSSTPQGSRRRPPARSPQRMRAQTRDRDRARPTSSLFVIDARAGVTPTDKAFARIVRASGRPVDPRRQQVRGSRRRRRASTRRMQLGLGEPVAISAEHGEGMSDLEAELLAALGLKPPPRHGGGGAARSRRLRGGPPGRASRREARAPTTRASRSASPSSAARTPASRRSSIRCSARSA